MSGPVDPPHPPEPPDPAGPGPAAAEQFNIGGGGPEEMVNALHVVEADPDIALADVFGDRSAPTLLVVEMPPDKVDGLKAVLGDGVIVEPNVPLEPFDD